MAAAGGCGKRSAPPSAPAQTPPPSQTAPSHASSRPAPGVFEIVTDQTGLHFRHQLADGKLSNIMESDGAGGAILDYNGDGFMDVYLVNSGPDPLISDALAGTPRKPNALFRNVAGKRFENVAAAAGVSGRGFGVAAAAADYDNDGDADLYVVNFGGGILYRNEGDGTFRDVTKEAGVVHRQAAISAAWLDADGDGWLDLFVANYLKYDPSVKLPPGSSQPYPGPLAYPAEFNILFRNRGDGRFEDVSETSGIRVPGHRAMSVTPLDYDLDGDEDLYVSNDGTPNLLLRNNGKGLFEDAALQCGVGFNQFGEAAGSMGAAVGDCNGDLLPDLFVTRFGRASLYVNSPGGFFEDRIVPSGILRVSGDYVAWGGNFLDYDNDGDLDIFIATGDPHYLKGLPPLLLENKGDGTFRNATAQGGEFFRRRFNARGSGAFDYDNDGWMDIVLTTLGGPAVLLHNRGGTNHWLGLQLVGSRSNRDGFGALVEVRAGGRALFQECRCPVSYVFQQDPRLHFGLGKAARAERIRIRWPSGVVQELTHVKADRYLTVKEPSAASARPAEARR